MAAASADGAGVASALPGVAAAGTSFGAGVGAGTGGVGVGAGGTAELVGGATAGAPASFLSQATKTRHPAVDKAAIPQEKMDNFIIRKGLCVGSKGKRNCVTRAGPRASPTGLPVLLNSS
jgi:hypothetical protein